MEVHGGYHYYEYSVVAAEPAAMGLGPVSARSADWFTPRTIRWPTTRREVGNGGPGGDGDMGGRQRRQRRQCLCRGPLCDNATAYCVNNTFGWNTDSAGTGGSGGHTSNWVYAANGANGVARGGGIARLSGTLNQANNIIAYNSPTNSYGTLVDLGHNISSDGSCNFTGAGSLNNTDPSIQPLADNGGPTLTLALSLGSPAIDTGVSAGAPAMDQRGFPRGVYDPSDIGAFELCGPRISDAVYRPGEGSGFGASSPPRQGALVPFKYPRTW